MGRRWWSRPSRRGGAAVTATARLPPSHFAAIGTPCCSRWGKLEIEAIALLYVQALANGGDTWRRLTRHEVLALLTDEQRQSRDARYLRDDGLAVYRTWFAAVDEALAAPNVAESVGGFWWRPTKDPTK